MNSRKAVNLIFFFNGFLFISWAARTPLIQELFDLDYDQLGYVLLASSIGSVLAMPLAGVLIQKYGSRIITIVSSFAFYISIPLFPWMGSYLGLLLVFFYMGASVGLLDVSMNGQAVEVERKWNRPIMTFFHAMFSIGMMVAAVSVSIVEHFKIDLWLHLAFAAGLAIVTMTFLSKYLIPDFEEVKSEEKASPKFFLPKGPIILLGLIAFCCMLGEGAMSEWTANYMKHVSFSSDVVAPLGLFSFSAAMTLGRLFGDKARTKYGDAKLITYGGVISTIGLSIVLLFPIPSVTILGLFIVGLGLSSIVPIVYSLAGNMPGIKPGVGISMATTIGYTGFLVGPPIIGLLADSYGLRTSWSFVLILFVVMVILVVLRTKKEA